MKRQTLKILYLLLVLWLLPAASLLALTYTWNGSLDSNWTNGANWDLGTMPGSADTALFSGAPLNNCTINTNANVLNLQLNSGFIGTVTVAPGSTLTTGQFSQIQGAFNVGTGNFVDNGSFSQSGGTFIASSGFSQMRGDFTVSAGTFLHNNGTLSFNGSANQTVSPGPATLYGVLISSTGGTVTLVGSWNVAGNWSYASGTVNPGSSTVNLTGGNQTLSGNNSFFNLTHISPAPATLSVGGSLNVTGNLDLEGAAGNLLTFNSTAAGTQRSLNSSGTRTLLYLAVQDSGAVGLLTASNSIDLGNNLNWSFPAPSFTPTPTRTRTATPTPSFTLSPTPTPIPAIPACASEGFGNSTSGGSYFDPDTNPGYIESSRFELFEEAQVYAITADVYQNTGGGSLQMAIYDNNVNRPGNLIAETGPFVPAATWVTRPLLSAVTLQPGIYYIAIQTSGGGGVAISLDSVGGTTAEWSTSGYTYNPTNFPSIFPAGGIGGPYRFSMHANYCPTQLYHGNRNVLTQGWLYTIDVNTARLSYRFTQPVTRLVSGVRIPVYSLTGSQPTYSATLEGDLNGKPNNLTLSTGTFTSVTGWVAVSISPLTLNAGQIYHLVVQYASGSISSSKCAAFLVGGDPYTGTYPFDQAPDPAAKSLLYASSVLGWEDRPWTPAFLLDTNQGVQGNPITLRSNYHASGGATPALADDLVPSQVFNTGGATWTVDKVAAHVSSTVASPGGPLYYELADHATGVIAAGGILVPNGTGIFGSQWTGVSLPARVTLQPGRDYRLSFRAPGIAATNPYQFHASYTAWDVAPYNTSTFEGVSAYARSSNTGGFPASNYTYEDLGFLLRDAQGPAPTTSPTPVSCNLVTLGGNGAAMQALTDGWPATAVGLSKVAGVDYNPADGLPYFSENDGQRVRRVDTSTGILTTVAGNGVGGYSGDGGQAVLAQLNAPGEIAFNGAGNLLYIADSANNRVRRVDLTSGSITTVAGTGLASSGPDGGQANVTAIKQPWGVAIAANGDLYVSELGGHKIRKVSFSTGIISTVVGTGAQADGPSGLTGTVTVINGPAGLAMATNGDIFFADSGNNRVRQWDAATKVITLIAGVGGAGSFGGDSAAATLANLNQPMDVDLDVSGYVYIADTLNHRIRRVIGGQINTFAGSGATTFNGDLPVASVNLNAPQGVALGSNGRLLIADTLHMRLREAWDCAYAPTPTPTATPTATPSPSATPTASSTSTRTSTPTPSSSCTPTASPTSSATPTATPTATFTASPSGTPSATPTASGTYTATPTATPTFSSSATPTVTLTATPTFSSSVTQTFSDTATASATPTFSSTATVTPTRSSTITPTDTHTQTPTTTPTRTVTATATATPSASITPTYSRTATASITGTFTHTATATPTFTNSITTTNTATPTQTPTRSLTISSTATPSPTRNLTETSTATPSRTATSTPTPSVSVTPFISSTFTATQTATPTRSATATPTASATVTTFISFTETPTRTQTPLPTASFTPTLTATQSPYQSPTDSPTVTPTWTISDTPLPTGTAVVPAVLSQNVFRPGKGAPLDINFKAPQSSRVTVKVFNLAGEKVREPFSADVVADQWVNCPWDGRNERGEAVGSGVYLVSVQGAGIKRIMKVVLIR